MDRTWFIGSALALTVTAYAGCANDNVVVVEVNGGARRRDSAAYVHEPERRGR